LKEYYDGYSVTVSSPVTEWEACNRHHSENHGHSQQACEAGVSNSILQTKKLKLSEVEQLAQGTF